MKTCGQCGKPAPSFAKVGDICPSCGARWGYERGAVIPSTPSDYSPALRKFIWIVLLIGLLAAMIIPAMIKHRSGAENLPASQTQPE